jgi:hypothetical protein
MIDHRPNFSPLITNQRPEAKIANDIGGFLGKVERIGLLGL